MRPAIACLLTAVLVACSQAASPQVSPTPPSPATPDQLSSLYGSYESSTGDIVVIARMGWFFDLTTSAYRTIYVEMLPDTFSIGCEFRVPVPTCADLHFTAGGLEVVDAKLQKRVLTRVHQKHTEVTISSGDAQLAGELTEPAGPVRGGIVIVHGAEPGQRQIYDVWVGIYTSLGLDVLTYDKRGIGASTGRYPGEFPTEEALKIYADDASAVLGFLARWPGVGAKVGFHGGSQGGWTVPLAISRHARGAFAVLVSAPATTVDQTDTWAGFSGGGQSLPTETNDQMLAAARAAHTGYDPAPALQSLSVPALWVLGTNDRTVPTALCIEVLSALHKPNFRIEQVPTGHGLLVNPTGLLADDDRSPGLAPQLVPTLREWLQAVA